MDQKKTAELNLEEILLTGFARLPEKSVLFSKYNGTIGVTLLVNRSTGKILEVASEDFSPLQINYFNKLLRGEEHGGGKACRAEHGNGGRWKGAYQHAAVSGGVCVGEDRMKEMVL